MTLAAIDDLSAGDIRGIVAESCELVGFQAAATKLSEGILARRAVLHELKRSFLARLGVTP